MDGDRIEIDGAVYIPAKQAGQLVGYTKDYVGQLARAGKINAKLIGRSWYVSEDSIRKHKLSVHYTLTKPKKRGVEKTRQQPVNTTKNTDTNARYKSSVEPDKQPVPLISKLSHDAGLSRNQQANNSSMQKVRAPQKNKQTERDVLVHTDIRYERGQRIHYGDESRDHGGSKKEPLRFENVPISRPREIVQIRSVRRSAVEHIAGHTQPRRGRVRMDGVRIQAHTRPQQTRNAEDHRVAYDRTAEEQDPHADDEHVPEQLRQKQHSKALPVLGSLLLFVLFLVWYLFIR